MSEAEVKAKISALALPLTSDSTGKKRECSHSATVRPPTQIHQLSMCVSPTFKLSNSDVLFWEAIEYNRLIGVEHFFVYDEGVFEKTTQSGSCSSSSKGSCKHGDVTAKADDYGAIMKSYLTRGIITLVPWAHLGDKGGIIDSHYHFQELALNHCLVKFGHSSNFLGFYDLDEYIVPMSLAPSSSSLLQVLQR